jgi:hypothetical protein
MFLDIQYFSITYETKLKQENLPIDQYGAWSYWWKYGQKEGCFPNEFVSNQSKNSPKLLILLKKPSNPIRFPDWGLILGENPDVNHQPSESLERFCYWEPFTRDKNQIDKLIKELFPQCAKIIYDFS